jgi:peptide/nickel transport system permease protein
VTQRPDTISNRGLTTAPAPQTLGVRRESPRAWGYLRVNPTFWIGAIGVVLIIGAAVFAPFLAPHDPNFQFRGEGLTAAGDPLGPSAKFPLGTDKLGRDELSRLLYGARTSLTVGIVANTLAVFIGVVVGTSAAFFRGRRLRVSALGRGASVPLPIETILMRTTDVVLAFPALLVAIALVAIVGPSLGLVIVVIALVLWTATARIMYTTSLVVLSSDFVLAATAIGVADRRLVTRHVLPHLLPLIIVYATLGIATTVLFEATLSFLGVGVPAPAASWGGMIIEHVGYYRTDPRVVALPGLAIMVTILAFNLLGDALADALDPRHWR